MEAYVRGKDPSSDVANPPVGPVEEPTCAGVCCPLRSRLRELPLDLCPFPARLYAIALT